MRIQTSLAVASLVLLGGCWPYLSGPYEDYVDGDPDTADPDSEDPDPDTDREPDTDRDPDTEPDTDAPDGDGPTVIGWTEIQYLMGGYWQTPGQVELTTVLGLTGPNATYRWIDSWPSLGSCGDSASPGPDLVAASDDYGIDSTVTVLAGTRSYDLSPAEDAPDLSVGGVVFVDAIPGNANVSGTFSTDDGTVTGTLARTPSDFTVVSPALDSDSVPVQAFGPVTIEWSGTLSDDIIVAFFTVNEDFAGTGGTFCRPTGNSITIDPADFDPDAAFAEIHVRRVRTYSASLGGSAGSTTRMHGLLTKVGFVAFQ